MRFEEAAFEGESANEIDMRGLVKALRRRSRTVLIPVVATFVGAVVFVNVVSPKYTAQTSILLENQETFFTRPDRVSLPADAVNQLDQEAVASQVQLISSPDLARRAIKQLGLAGNPEFDPAVGGLNPLRQVMILLGVIVDPARLSPEQRLTTKFLDQLLVYSPTKTRVLAIEFTSKDPVLAARVTNTMAQLYLQEQSAAKRSTARQSAEALAAQVTDLRAKLIAADEERERYRVKTGLLGGGTTTISNQQLADINTDLSKARATQADAAAKAALIRDLIRDGKTADVADIVNNDLVRRVADQRYAAQAMLARESRTLLPAHPRIKELAAQVSEYDTALKQAARQAADSLENESKIAGLRVANLEAALSQQKTVAGTADADAVHLRALERITQSYKDQLDSSTTKYQEALARQNSTATPADARIIASATPPQEPSFPKKLPIIVFATLAALVFSAGYVVASELMGGEGDNAPAPSPLRAPTARPRRQRPADMNPAAPEPAARDAFAASASADPAPLAPEEMPETVPNTRAALALRRQAWAFPEPTGAEVGLRAAGPLGDDQLPHKSVRPLRLTTMLQDAMGFLRGFGQSAAAAREARRESEDPVLPPVPSEAVADVARAKSSPRADAATSDTGPSKREISPSGAPPSGTSRPDLLDTDGTAERIVAAHVPGRGLHVVGLGLGAADGAQAIIALGRTLAVRGRTILVDLDQAPERLGPLAAPGREGRAGVAGLKGLAELLDGRTTFAEVIQKDHASRLHFIASGQGEAEFQDFDLIIEALSETYDFVLMLPPDHPQLDVAKAMSPFADFVVLGVAPGTAADVVEEVERALRTAGAAEILVAEVETAERKVA